MDKAKLTVFVLVAIVATAGTARSADGPADPATKWEYRVLTKDQVIELGKKDLAAGLNAVGDEGWELAAVDSAYIFKRPKQSKSLDELQRQVTAATTAMEQLRERAAFSERLLARGYVSAMQVEADRQRLKSAETILEKAKKELEAIQNQPKKAPDGEPKSRR